MNTEIKQLPITPETKVGALLEFYPQLEKVLIEMAPTFKNLENPILRKTIGKVTTLMQVAQIEKVSLADVINKLREVVGQESNVGIAENENSDETVPSWFDIEKVTITLDARPIIEAGEHPLDAVFRDLRKMESGQIYELITPFIPAPMIEKAKNQGFQSWVKKESDDFYYTYFIPG